MTDQAPDPLAPETPVPPRRAEEDARPLRLAVAVLALAFLMVPPLLAVAGVSGGPLERERAASRPRLSDGWDAFDRATEYVTQKLPFRANGVDANTWIANHVWGHAPDYGRGGPGGALPFESVQGSQGGGAGAAGAAAVSTGPNGWLFLEEEFGALCRPAVDPDTAIARWTQFVDEIRASGRKVVLLVVPEKSSVYPEQVKPDATDWDCAHATKNRLWAKLAAQRDPAFVPLLAPLLDLKRSDPGRLIYLRLNTHWNPIGALVLPKLALERLGGPARVRAQDVSGGTTRYDSDLAPFMGRSAKESSPLLRISRPAGSEVLPGRTLFLHDSFGDLAEPLLKPYLARMEEVTWRTSNPDEVARAIGGADTVIVETVEREFISRAAEGVEGSVVTPDFLRSLPERLGSPPG